MCKGTWRCLRTPLRRSPVDRAVCFTMQIPSGKLQSCRSSYTPMVARRRRSCPCAPMSMLPCLVVFPQAAGKHPRSNRHALKQGPLLGHLMRFLLASANSSAEQVPILPSGQTRGNIRMPSRRAARKRGKGPRSRATTVPQANVDQAPRCRRDWPETSNARPPTTGATACNGATPTPESIRTRIFLHHQTQRRSMVRALVRVFARAR